jgi:hypothetical protein
MRNQQNQAQIPVLQVGLEGGNAVEITKYNLDKRPKILTPNNVDLGVEILCYSPDELELSNQFTDSFVNYNSGMKIHVPFQTACIVKHGKNFEFELTLTPGIKELSFASSIDGPFKDLVYPFAIAKMYVTALYGCQLIPLQIIPDSSTELV